MKKYLIDSNILMALDSLDDLIKKFEKISIPSEVLYELDRNKTAEGDKGFKCRRAIRNIKANLDSIDFVTHTVEENEKRNISNTIVDDLIIDYAEKDKDFSVITNDIGMELKAKAKNIETSNFYHSVDITKGYKEVVVDKKSFKRICDCIHKGIRIYPEIDDGLKVGEYLILRNSDKLSEHGKVFKYFGENLYAPAELDKISNGFFRVEAKDEYQACVIDSLYTNKFTVITGPAGTGKTLISLAYCFQKINEGYKIHMLVNPVKTKGSETLGYYSGDRNEKLMQNFVGTILNNKVGNPDKVLEMIERGDINLYPFSDIRGIEIKKKEILYITEAQNLSVDLMKLAIQRCADGCKIIIEGDPHTQVDSYMFNDSNNGLKRLIEVFAGEEDFSQFYLSKVYRSRFAELAEQM